MVTEWGMGERTGLVAYDLDGENAFLGQRALEGQSRVYSEAAAERVDAEVEGLLEQAHRQAYTILTEHRMALEQLAQALLQEEKLERDQVLAIISGTPVAQEGAGSGESTKGKPIAGGGQ